MAETRVCLSIPDMLSALRQNLWRLRGVILTCVFDETVHGCDAICSATHHLDVALIARSISTGPLNNTLYALFRVMCENKGNSNGTHDRSHQSSRLKSPLHCILSRFCVKHDKRAVVFKQNNASQSRYIT